MKPTDHNNHAGVVYSPAPDGDENEKIVPAGSLGDTEIQFVNNNSRKNSSSASNKGKITISRCFFYILIVLIVILFLLLLLMPFTPFFYLDCSGNTMGNNNQSDTMEPSPELSLRLPINMVPSKYDLLLKVYMPASDVIIEPEKLFTFQSQVTITLKCERPSRYIVLNTIEKWGKIDQSSIKLIDQESNEQIDLASDMELRGAYEQVVFTFTESLQPGVQYKLSMIYNAKISSDDLNGFYYVKYQENNEERYVAVTQFQPTYARTFLPCFDEPKLKAVFTVTIVHPAKLTALSNTSPAFSSDIGNGWRQTIYQQTPIMSTYLLAVVISEFESAERFTKSGTRVRVWARPSLLNQAEYAANAGKTILEYFEDYFGLPYPLAKQDMIACPDFDAGAMENWGLVTYRDVALMYSNTSTNSKTKYRVTEIIAHELAHQWFGNLVTISWWNDLWLNEGFATFLQYYGVASVLPDAEPLQQYAFQTAQQALDTDQTLSTRPIQFDAHNITEIHQLFDRIAYDKGSSVVRMMQYISGNEVMKDSLRTYLRNNQYGSGTMFEVFELISTGVGMERQGKTDTRLDPDVALNLTQVIYCWVRRAGYPLVTVKRDDQRNTAILTQNRFLASGDPPPESDSDMPPECAAGWYIPIWYRTQKDSEQKFAWMEPDKPLKLEGLNGARWILVNDESRAFARVNYEERDWQELIYELKRDHTQFDPNTRSQMIDDVFTTASAGLLNHSVALDLSLYLERESHDTPWRTFSKAVQYIDHMVKSQPNYTFFKEFQSQLFSRLFHRTQNDTRYTGDKTKTTDRFLRNTAWRLACKFDHPDCVRMAMGLFRQMKSDCANKSMSAGNCNRIDAELRDTIYSTSASKGQADDWDFLWDQLSNYHQETSERNALLHSVGNTVNPEKIQILLDEAFKMKVLRNSEIGSMAGELTKTEVGRKAMWKLVTENWADLKKKYQEATSLQHMVSAMSMQLSSEEEIKALEDFIKNNDLGGSQRPATNNLQQAKDSNKWIKLYASKIIDWARLYQTRVAAFD